MLDLIWIAQFNDGSEICQYEQDGSENLFKDVLDRQETLVRFALVRRKDAYTYLVDLQKGCISLQPMGGTIIEPRADMLRKAEYAYRLIYFREVERTFNSNLEEVEDAKYTYFLGFQYTDDNGSNQKRIMKIKSNGDLVVN